LPPLAPTVDPSQELERQASAVGAKVASAGLRAQRREPPPGGKLPADVRPSLVPIVGHGVSDLRVHTGSAAARAAASLGAQAFTHGRDVYFGAGEYRPDTSAGLALIAHEAVHAMQQGAVPRATFVTPLAPRSIQRQPRPTASAQAPGTRGTAGRGIRIRWTGSIQSSLFDFARALGAGDEAAAAAARQVAANASRFDVKGKSSTREEFERAPRRTFDLDPNLTETLAAALGTTAAALRTQAPRAAVIQETQAALAPIEAALEGRAPPAREEQERQAARWSGPRTPVRGQWAVLGGNEPLARSYLRLMENFAGLQLTPATTAAASGGLTEAELSQLVGQDQRLRVYTNLFTQGWAEFVQAGGTEIPRFEPLEERIFEQFTWGNPTAARNQLKIGTGWPENAFGITERSGGMLLYDATGMPLPSFSGMLMRDHGYVGAKPPGWGIDIGSVNDPAIRMFLNILRQQFGDPTRMVGAAAKAYKENIDLVNARVAHGLTEEVIRKFEQMLPVFVGFLAGHGLSSVLLASPNPVLMAIGGALRGLLTGVGYILDIDFAGSALARVLEAGYHLSRVVKRADGTFTELSEYHLDQAAGPLRSMVADVAAMMLMERLGEVFHGRESARLECTRCSLGKREARARERAAERNEIAEWGKTRTEIEGLRREVIERPRPDAVSAREHRGAEDHGVPDAIVLRTINDPQVIMLSRNGNWVFYRNGTIVVTPRGEPGIVRTAYGRGGTVPGRRVADVQALYPEAGLRVGSPEPPVRLETWKPQQEASRKDFAVKTIWP
jgi:hypothetical protein